MFIIFYNFLLILFALFSLPRMLYDSWRYGKYRASFKSLLGKDFPKIDKGNHPLIWIHAVSLGETKAIAPLAKMLKDANPSCILLISSTTETGHSEAKKSLNFADFHVYLPFDFSWTIRPIVRKIKPDLVLLCETDFWYNFLDASKKEGAKVAVVNRKI